LKWLELQLQVLSIRLYLDCIRLSKLEKLEKVVLATKLGQLLQDHCLLELSLMLCHLDFLGFVITLVLSLNTQCKL
jgi:hypothetical protein